MASACAINSSGIADDGEDLSTGTPAAIAASLALTLLPASSRMCESGPIKAIELARAASANSGFSDKKP